MKKMIKAEQDTKAFKEHQRVKKEVTLLNKEKKAHLVLAKRRKDRLESEKRKCMKKYKNGKK